MLKDEVIPENEYEIFDEHHTWKRKKLSNYYIRELQEKIFENGKLIYKSPSLKEIAEHCRKELSTIWDEVKRLENPQKYYVDLSQELYDLKQRMLNKD